MELKLGSRIREWERTKEREGRREIWWTIKHKEKWGGSETERHKVLLKSCFRLMAHLPKVSETLPGSRSKRSQVVNHHGNRWHNGHRYDIEFWNICPYVSRPLFYCVEQRPSATQNYPSSRMVSTVVEMGTCWDCASLLHVWVCA